MRRGFTLIEMLVTLAILAGLAALIAPSLLAEFDRARIDRALTTLESIADAIVAFEDDVGEHPASITQLNSPLVSGDADICGSNYNGGERNRWGGPYLDRLTPPGGIDIDVGTIPDNFFYDSAPTPDILFILINGIQEQDILSLDDRLDGDGGQGTGVIQWTNPDANGVVTGGYAIPIGTC
jgi:prepilin-type N-terminal cleavage/methylation domain-containing protein